MQKARASIIARAVLLLLLGVIVFKARSAIADVFAVSIYALLFASILSPICIAFEKRGISTSVAAALSLCILILSVFILAGIFMPYIIAQSIELLERIEPVLSNLYLRFSVIFDNQSGSFLKESGLTELITPLTKKLAYMMAGAGFTAAASLGRLFFSAAVTYYVLRDRRILSSHLMLFLPSAWRRASSYILQSCKNAVMSYSSSLVKTSFFIAGVTYLMLVLLRIPNALLLALLMGILEILPYIGPVLASVPILLNCLPAGIHTTLLVMILLILIQQIEGSLITPYFTASTTSLHPLAALMSVLIFGKLFGIGGILFAVPLVIIARNVIWSAAQFRNLMNDQEMIET